MFGKGDYVYHASGGVCLVDDVTYAPLEGMPADRLYYVLKPVHDRNGVIYLPTDCNTVFLRPLLNREEAAELVREVPKLSCLEAEDAKSLRLAYVDAMKTHDPYEWVRVIKTVYERTIHLAEVSRTQRLSETERSYGEEAKKHLFTELSLVLDLPDDKVEHYVFGPLAEAN